MALMLAIGPVAALYKSRQASVSSEKQLAYLQIWTPRCYVWGICHYNSYTGYVSSMSSPCWCVLPCALSVERGVNNTKAS